MVNRALLFLLVQSSMLASSSFTFLANFETGSDGTPTPALLSTGTIANSPLAGGTWTTNGDVTDSIFIWSGYNIPLPNFTWNGVVTNDAGTRGIALSCDHSGDANSGDIRYTFPSTVLPISGGLMVVQNLTNESPTIIYNDLFYIEPASVGNSSAVEYRADNGWYAHGTSNSVTLNGPFIAHPQVGVTNWITWLRTESNFTINVYNPFTHALEGTSSIGHDNAAISRVRLLAYTQSRNQAGTTNFVDNIVLDATGTFPILPWDWIPAPFIRVVSP